MRLLGQGGALRLPALGTPELQTCCVSGSPACESKTISARVTPGIRRQSNAAQKTVRNSRLILHPPRHLRKPGAISRQIGDVIERQLLTDDRALGTLIIRRRRTVKFLD